MSFLIDRTRLLTAAILLLLSLSLTGCTRIQTSIEDLMSPPVLTEEQAQIRDALAQVSGETELKYKYPQNGEYRSSFIFYDIDGDGIGGGGCLLPERLQRGCYLDQHSGPGGGRVDFRL